MKDLNSTDFEAHQQAVFDSFLSKDPDEIVDALDMDSYSLVAALRKQIKAYAVKTFESPQDDDYWELDPQRWLADYE